MADKVLRNKLEIQAEILNHRRYTVITERYCMTHSDTGHQDLTVKSLRDFSLLSLLEYPHSNSAVATADQSMLQTLAPIHWQFRQIIMIIESVPYSVPVAEHDSCAYG